MNIKTGGPGNYHLHPEAGQVEVSCEYALSSMLVWEIPDLSVEPFYDSILMPEKQLTGRSVINFDLRINIR